MSEEQRTIDCLKEELQQKQMKLYEVTAFSQVQAGKIKGLEEALETRTKQRDVLRQQLQTVHDFTECDFEYEDEA